jgi:peptidoglycan/LPS O-acetylase OafA/YrhL
MGVSEMAGRRLRDRVDRSGVLVVLIAAGLAVAGFGFMAAGVDAGPGPRAVHGAVSIGPVYLPPFLTGLVALAVAGVQARRARWAPAAGAVLAVVLLAGALTLGRAGIWWRLAHPGAAIGFAEDTAQLAGEITAIAAGVAAIVSRRRPPPPPARRPDGDRRPASAGRGI